MTRDTDLDELVERLAQQWEAEIEEVAEISGPGDIFGPIENVAKMQCVIELRYIAENGELPPDSGWDGYEYTNILENTGIKTADRDEEERQKVFTLSERKRE